MLLYSTLGAQWTYSSRVTYSFMPDGTDVGGTPSALFQTLNAVAPTATWEGAIEQAAALWENAANINLAPVPDGGESVGTNGDQQDDPRFGDIRIGAIPLPYNVLAETFVPPPINGGTAAGDILFNSSATVNWGVNNGFAYDVMSVAAHEFGHALGLGDSSVQGAVMYGAYQGITQSLSSDDVAGIRAIYGAPQYDVYNQNGKHNGSFLTASNITPDINGQGQITLPNLDLAFVPQAEWFAVTVPASTTGQMTVTVQSSNLSSLCPGLMIYNNYVQLISDVGSSNPGGGTVSLTLNVQPGQKYYLKVVPGTYGQDGTIGACGLLVNFGSQTQSPIPPPNTVVPDQPDQGGGVSYAMTGSSPQGPTGTPNPPSPLTSLVWTTIGTLSGWVAQTPTVAASGSSSTGGARLVLWAPPSGPSNAGVRGIGALPAFSTATEGPIATSPSADSGAGHGFGLGGAPQPIVDVVFQAADVVLGDRHGRHKWAPAHRRHHH
jgi:hypothetical protein